MPDGSEFKNTPEQIEYLEDNNIDLADLEVDDDRVHEDDKLNNYLEYNYEAERFYNKINDAIESISPDSIRDGVNEF
jgi:hypothetical protein